MTFKLTLCSFLFTAVSFWANAQEIALLNYEGGGDWYANPTALPNLIAFCNTHIDTRLSKKPATVKSTATNLYRYPFIHMTGHGNVFFSDEAVTNLRNYLLGGGFLHIDDNYGMDPYIRPQLLKLFPEEELKEIPLEHPLYSIGYSFPKGLPKIHEHDGKNPLALGIFKEGRLVLLYTTEADLGDGWENAEIHSDPEEVRLKALQMGANIIKFAFEN